MSELFNLVNQAINVDKIITAKPAEKTDVTVGEPVNASISIGTDGTEIETQTSKSSSHARFQFVEKSSFQIGISFKTTVETREALSFGISLMQNLGSRSVTHGGRISIPNDPITSLVLNLASYAAR